jgi:hypothetical protein
MGFPKLTTLHSLKFKTTACEFVIATCKSHGKCKQEDSAPKAFSLSICNPHSFKAKTKEATENLTGFLQCWQEPRQSQKGVMQGLHVGQWHKQAP